MRRRLPFLLVCLLPLALLAQESVSPEDRKRFEEIKSRHERGEQVSAEDQAFARHIMGILNSGGQKGKANPKGNAEYAKAHPPQDSVGFTPLTELGTGLYKGEEGGLYPGGSNTPPAQHLAKGQSSWLSRLCRSTRTESPGPTARSCC